MAYLTFSDFRTASLAEYCVGLDLTSTEASDSLLPLAISRLSDQFDDFTNDHFETESLTLSLSGEESASLPLPKRCTAVSSVAIVDESGTSTTQTSTVYRLVSSLYSAGSKRLSEEDRLEIIWGAGGLSGLPASAWDPYSWPNDANSISVTGSFGWTTTPGKVKRAVALMVWDHFKTKRGDLRMAQSISASGSVVNYPQPDYDAGIYTGIAEVDSIIHDYRRESGLKV